MADSFTQSSDLGEVLRSGTATGLWTVDPSASTAEFAVKNFWGLMTVRGRLERVEGRAEVSADGEVSASISFESGSVETGNRQRDKHLRSEDFFHAEQHPTVTFASRSVAPAPGGRLHVQGVLTAAGHDLAVEFDAALDLAEANRAVVEGTVVVDRTALGMRWSPLGMAAAVATLTLRLTFRHVTAA